MTQVVRQKTFKMEKQDKKDLEISNTNKIHFSILLHFQQPLLVHTSQFILYFSLFPGPLLNFY